MTAFFPGLVQLITRHEGRRLASYRDSLGNITIGVGHNITSNGITITDAHCDELLDDDTASIYGALTSHATFTNLDQVRQIALIDMGFMGVGKLMGFRKMWAALDTKDFHRAADELLKSEYATQVGIRARDLAAIIRTGRLDA